MSFFLGKRIKKYRKMRDLTRKKLAEKVGVAENTIYRYESGDINISMNILVKIADALNIPPSKLLDPIHLEEARKQAGYTPEELAKKVGVDPKTYLKWEHHLDTPPPEMKEKLEEILEENLDFSIEKGTAAGSGNEHAENEDQPGARELKGQKKRQKAEADSSQTPPEPPNAQYLTSDMIEVPIINYSAGAGKPFVVTDMESYIESYIYLPKGFVPNGGLFAIRVQGDSMEPKFREGDYAVVNVNAEVFSGNIAVVQIDTEELLIKQVFWKEARKTAELRSINPKYKPQVIETKEISFIGKVVGKWENIF